MIRTFSGERELPGLPLHEMQLLKNQILTMFPVYWNTPAEFEALWIKCAENNMCMVMYILHVHIHYYYGVSCTLAR